MKCLSVLSFNASGFEAGGVLKHLTFTCNGFFILYWNFNKLNLKTLEDVAECLRRVCKRSFFKHVSERPAMNVINTAFRQGFVTKGNSKILYFPAIWLWWEVTLQVFTFILTDFIDIGNENGKTALMFASQLQRSHKLVEYLLAMGANPNKPAHRGHTAVIYAASWFSSYILHE